MPKPQTGKSYRWDTILAMALGCNLGNLSFISLPMWLMPTVERFGLEPGAAGYIASAEMAVVTITCLLISPRVDRIPWRKFCLVA